VDLLLRRYLQILAVALTIGAVITLIGFTFPQPLLWLLGQNYASLQAEIGWVVLNGSLAYLGGVLWSMHAARRWIFWWVSIVYIITILITQVICVTIMDLGQTRSVIYFGLITTGLTLLLQASVGVRGLFSERQTPKHLASQP
jgi:hypothetical protein